MLTTALALSLALAGQPWDVPFAPDTAAQLAAAAALPPPEGGAEVDLLLEEVSLDLDEAGRVTWESRLVSVTRTAAAVRAWGTAAAGYAPWFQDRPDLKVRVLAPGGEVRWLDPATLVEATPGDQAKDEVFSDRRELRGPIPGLEPGALLEERLLLRDRQPHFKGGAFLQFRWMRRAPVRRVSLRVSAPAGLPLRWQADGLPKPVETTEAGRKVLRWELSPLPAAEPAEPLSPPDGTAGRRISLSTGRSWREVAAGYRELVERQLEGADLAATARAIVAPGDGPVQAAQKILDFIAAKVRYTGLSLGERAIVPARPAETLARGYGDCKDMSTLAVGLLRAAGHDASVALMALERADPLPDLPGLAFDHAVVRVGGRLPFWFDPTDPATPAGGLPPWLQGRLALPTHREATGLQRTPEAAAADAGWSKVRRIELPARGWASVFEETTYRGSAAAEIRRHAAALSAADRERMARERLGAVDGEPASMTVDAEPRSTGPARVRAQAAASRWGTTEENSAEVLVTPHPIYQRLPDHFRTEPLQAGARDEPPPARTGPMRLPEAYTADLRYEVVPPPGFRPVGLPAGETAKVGPFTMESTFTSAPGGAVVVTWRFTAARRLLSAAEADALWRDVAERTRREGPRLRFERTALALLQEGKGKEAVAELQRLVALQPAAARHHCHLAATLLSLGLGAEARAEARRAVALDPSGEWPLRVLAYALHHDLLGQPFGPGADVAGAIEVQRRVVALVPESPVALGMLARLLEQGAGERYGPGARLEEALAIRRRLRTELKSDEGLVDLAALLLQTGHATEALAAARAAPAGPDRNGILLAAAALARGPDGLLEESGDLPAGDRLKAATGATARLLTAGQYGVLRDVAERARLEGRATKESEAFAAIALRIRAFDPKKLDRRDPASLPHRLLLASLGPAPEVDLPAMTSRQHGTAADLLQYMRRSNATANPYGLSRRAIVDFLTAALEVKVEGDGPPWRVRCTLMGVGEEKARFSLVGVREDGEARVVLADPTQAGYARMAQRAAARGDLGAARRLLGWALESEGGTLARTIWRTGEAAGQEELELAAYALGGPGTPEEARTMLKRLEAERAGATGALRGALGVAAIGAAARAGQHAKVQALADELAPPGSKDWAKAHDYVVRALIGQGRLSNARSALEDRLADDGDDRTALGLLTEVTQAQGEFEVAAATARRLLAGKSPRPEDFHEAAWNELFRARPGEEALSWARRGKGGSVLIAESLAVLAAVQAWTGQPAEAMTSLRGAVEARGGTLEADDWLVIGRVAEAYGIPGAAVEAYRKVALPERSKLASAYELARRRLEGLEAAGARE